MSFSASSRMPSMAQPDGARSLEDASDCDTGSFSPGRRLRPNRRAVMRLVTSGELPWETARTLCLARRRDVTSFHSGSADRLLPSERQRTTCAAMPLRARSFSRPPCPASAARPSAKIGQPIFGRQPGLAAVPPKFSKSRSNEKYRGLWGTLLGSLAIAAGFSGENCE